MLVGFSQADRTVLKKQLSKCAATIRHRVNIQPDTASCSHAATEAFRRKFGDGTETDSHPCRTQNTKGCRHRGYRFSILLILIFWLLRISVPADPLEPGTWLATSSRSVCILFDNFHLIDQIHQDSTNK